MEGPPPDTTAVWLNEQTTSPSQLQEITLDQDVNYSIRSPSGPLRGRSVKEFEEQLSALKKENFNLKLRIYFLEERMGPNFQFDKENVIKNNIELNVEVETLKKEVESKTELLEQALKALELQDEEYKKVKNEKEEVIIKMQQEMEQIKSQVVEKVEKELSTSRSVQSEYLSVQDNNSHIVKELEEKITYLEEELNQEKSNNTEINVLIEQKDKKIQELFNEINILQRSLTNYEEQIRLIEIKYRDTINDNQQTIKKLKEKSRLIDDIMEQNNELRKKCHLFKHDYEKEQKKLEKLEQTNCDLESKLQTALHELRKSQDLVVSQNSMKSTRNTDPDYFLAKKSTSPIGIQKEIPFTISKYEHEQPQLTTTTTPTTPSPIPSPTSSPKSIKLLEKFNNNINEITPQNLLQIKLEFEQYQEKIIKLKADQVKACKIIKTMIETRNKPKDEILLLKNEKIDLLNKINDLNKKLEELIQQRDEYKRKNRELECELEGVVTKPKRADFNFTPTDPKDETMDNEELMQYKILVEQLEEKNQLLAATLKEKSSQMDCLQEQHDNLVKALENKEHAITDLEFELLSQEKSDETSEKAVGYFEKIIKEKDADIAKLNNELIKKNSDLQGIVNNELWQKNKEIEKLQKIKQTNFDNNEEIIKLKKELASKDLQLKLINSKINELGIDLDVKLQDNLQEELEKSEKLRNEANKMCSVLSGRLEELAIFLDSLLKQKSVLGLLGVKENKKIRQIVEYSLDLTRSFSMSLTMNPDESLAQLTNLSSILNNTAAENLSFTYKSHLYNDKEEIIETLRQQIINLKHELQLRDVELGKLTSIAYSDVESGEAKKSTSRSTLNTSTTLKYHSEHSESEAWSEPDRNVSRERMGLMVNNNQTQKSVESESEEDLLTPRSSKKSLEGRNTIIELHKQVCDLDVKLNEAETKLNESEKVCSFINNQLEEERQKNENLKQQLNDLEVKFTKTKAQLEEAEDRTAELEEKTRKYKQLVEELEERKHTLEDYMAVKDKEVLNKINQIQIEKEEALKEVEKAQLEAEKSKEIQQKSEETIRNLQEELEVIRTRSEEMILKKVKDVEQRAQAEVNKLKQSLSDLQKEYGKNYVKKSELETALAEVDVLRKSLKTLEHKEKELKEKLHEYQDKYNTVRNDLDNATLQFSEAVLEKTKISNDKVALEKELSTYSLKEAEMRKQLNEIQIEVNESKQNYQKQLQTLQNQRSKLEVRISELESSNAELHNKLVKLQARHGDHIFSTSLPNYLLDVPKVIGAHFARQTSENSGYTSEEQQIEEVRPRFLPYNNNNRAAVVEFERHEANSSPDLGIESDHGRFSSLETPLNLPRPFLQSLELTESMNNLLDGDNNVVVQNANCGNEICFQKVQSLTYENGDLRRKLLRTKRALEETVNQLTLANQRKKEVEKNISKQILKTSLVLRKAKANLDSGSETELTKK